MIIIFDLDGTLINTISDLGQACNHALAACGFPTHKIEDYPRLVGNGVNKLIERALPQEYRNEETVLRLRKYFVPYYDEHNCDFTHPYDGIEQLLKTLKEQGHFLAVASNKYQAATEKIVAQLFPGIFDVVLGEREGVERKPHPQIVYDIIKNYELRIKNYSSEKEIQNSKFKIQNVLYIGDSLVDAETARAAASQLSYMSSASNRTSRCEIRPLNCHISLALCTWGFGTQQQMQDAHPDYLVHHPLEILEIKELKQ